MAVSALEAAVDTLIIISNDRLLKGKFSRACAVCHAGPLSAQQPLLAFVRSPLARVHARGMAHALTACSQPARCSPRVVRITAGCLAHACTVHPLAPGHAMPLL